jgi:uncharacterized protein YndB with AHSA1/START domain
MPAREAASRFLDMRESVEAIHWGTYRVIDPPRKLVFTWFTSAEEERENTSVVTIPLEPDGKGCVVTLIHQVNARNARFVPQTQKGWAGMLDGIDPLQEIRLQPPGWPRGRQPRAAS